MKHEWIQKGFLDGEQKKKEAISGCLKPVFSGWHRQKVRTEIRRHQLSNLRKQSRLDSRKVSPGKESCFDYQSNYYSALSNIRLLYWFYGAVRLLYWPLLFFLDTPFCFSFQMSFSCANILKSSQFDFFLPFQTFEFSR